MTNSTIIHATVRSLRDQVGGMIHDETPGVRVPFHVCYCEADDMPWSIVLGEVCDGCLRYDGYTAEMALKRFETFGMPLVRVRVGTKVRR